MDVTRPDELQFQHLDRPGRGRNDPQRHTLFKTDYGERNTEYMPQTVYDDPDNLTEAPGDAHPALPPPDAPRTLLAPSTPAPVDASSVIVREWVPPVGGRKGTLQPTAGSTGSRFTRHVVNGGALVKRVLATAPTQHPYTHTHREVGDADGVPVVKDLPIEQWPFPGDQENRIVRYDDPRPTFYHGNPRPSYHAAVRSNNPDLVRKTLLNNSFLEDISAEGLGAIQDPTGQLAAAGVNRSIVCEEWVACNPAAQTLPCASAFGGAAEGAATRRIKVDETPLGRAVAACQGASAAGAAAAAEVVRLLSEHPQCNPNLPTVYYDVEPAAAQTASDATLLEGAAQQEPPQRPARRIRGAPAGRAVRRREPEASGAAALRERAYYTLSVSPLYHALYFGLEDAAAVLLKNPLVDPRVGVSSDDPRSQYETRRCSSLDPSLAALEEELDRVDAAQASPRAEGRVETLMAYEFAAAPRVSRRENTQSTSQTFANVGANVRSFY